MSVRISVGASAAVIVAALASSSAWGQGASHKYGELLKRLPEHANVLLLVDVDGLVKSPLGQREKWGDEIADRPSGVLGVTSGASKLAVAMSMDLQSLDERWKLGMVETKAAPPKLSPLARREGGYVEQLELQNVAWTPRNLFLFTFPERIIGFAAPTDRQLLAVWLRGTLGHPRQFPPSWADRAINRADRGSQIVLALDLRNVISPKHAEVWLKNYESGPLKQHSINAELLSARISGVQSAFLQIEVKETIRGTLYVEFDLPIDLIKPIAKDLVLATLSEYGAEIGELKRWDGRADGKAITLSGALSEDVVKRILNVVCAPRLSIGPETADEMAEPATIAAESAKTESAKPTSTKPATAGNAPQPSQAASSGDPGLHATRQYYYAVTEILRSLKAQKSDSQAGQKLWYDRAAKQIEELPLLNVDSDLLDWGSTVARTLREMAYGINYTVKDRTHRIAGLPNGYYGGYGASSKGYNASVINKQTNAVLNVELDGRWQVLETSIADMRRKLIAKYKVEF